MTLDEGISRLIGDIYAGAADSAIWRRAMRELVRRTDSRFGMVTVVDTRTGEFNSSEIFGPDEGRFLDGVREYDEGVFRDDPMLRFGIANPGAGKVGLLDVVARAGSDTRQDSYVRWNRDVLAVGDCPARYTPPREGFIFSVSLAAKVDNHAHALPDLALFDMLFGHIRSALELSVRPPDFASSGDARILLNARGRVLAASPAAEALLSQRDGLAIAGGTLRAARAADSRRIEQLVGSALSVEADGGCGGAMRVPRTGPGRDYILIVAPLPHPPGPFAAYRPCADLRIVDLDACAPPGRAERWIAAFGLTPAEARLADALCAGECDLRQASDHCGVTYATARSQLASVFRKTDTHSQPQLVRLLTLAGG